MTVFCSGRAARWRRGFTLIEIMVSLMIFVVVSGAMVSILMISTELFRRGEFSRSANDETIAVLGAVSDDLNHLVPETGDGWFYAGIPSASGNTLVAFTTAGQNPDGIGARGQNARSVVGTWVEETALEEPRLRRLVLDDSRDCLDFVSSLVITSGQSGQVVTDFDNLEVVAYNAVGGPAGSLVSLISPGRPAAEVDWIGRQVMRAMANNTAVADVEFRCTYDWKKVTGASGPVGDSRVPLTVVIPSSVLTQGCLHFSAWVALNDIPGMQRPKNANRQPDWEQLDVNGGTRLGPWGPGVDGSGMAEAYDTRPQNWVPPALNAISAVPKPPFPSAVRLSFVLTGGGRFAPRGLLQSELTNSPAGSDLRFGGITGLSSSPGSMVRIGDEWIAYHSLRNGLLTFAAHAVESGPGRGARRSRVTAHPRGEVLRVGQSYSLVRAIPR